MEDFTTERVKAVALRLGFELSEGSDSQDLEAKIYNLAKFFYIDGIRYVAHHVVDKHQKHQNLLEDYQNRQNLFIDECKQIVDDVDYTQSYMLGEEGGSKEKNHER